jgi:hypothetical protein
MKCPNCGAPGPALTTKGQTCGYCETPFTTEPEAKRKVIKSDMGRYAKLEDVELRGDMNRVQHAVNCLIVGDMNRVWLADDRTEMRGDMNRVKRRT